MAFFGQLFNTQPNKLVPNWDGSDAPISLQFNDNFTNSGDGGAATETGTLTYETGKHLKAGVFDGASNLSFADDDAIDVGTGDFTTMFWIKMVDANEIQSIFAKVDTSSTSPTSTGAVGFDLLYRGDQSGDRLSCRFNDGTGSSTMSQGTGTQVVDDGSWHHVACVFDRTTDGEFDMYVDGTNVYNTDISGKTATMSNDGPFKIGTRRAGNGWHFNGSLDRFFFIKRELTQAEVHKEYNYFA